MSVKNLDVHPRYVTALLHSHIRDINKLLCFSSFELVKKTGLGENAIKGILDAASKYVCATSPTSVLDIVNGTSGSAYHLYKLPTYLGLIDKQLCGGIVYPGVTEICGESGSGKTQLALHLCLSAQVGNNSNHAPPGALYICTEDPFPTKRLHQMAEHFTKKHFHGSGKTSSHLTDRIYIEHCVDLEDLWSLLDGRIHALLLKVKLKIIVIDSIAALFRTEYDLSEMQERAKMLAKFGRLLLDMSSKYKLCVICINQVSDMFAEKRYTSTDVCVDGSRSVIPALGLTWSHWVNTRLKLSRTHHKTSMFTSRNNQDTPSSSYEVVIRSLRVVHSSYLPSSKSYFLVHEGGIKDFQF